MEYVTKLHGARWIGLPEDRICIKDIQKVYFRTQFDLKAQGFMKLVVSAHCRYKLWVNGERVGAGPCKGDKWHWYYDEYDVSSMLKQGTNVIAAEVIYYPPHAFKGSSVGGPWSVVSLVMGPWLIMKGECRDGNGNVLADITTGSSEWIVKVDESITWEKSETELFQPVGSFEQVTGSLYPRGWMMQENLSGESESWLKAIAKWEADGCAWGSVPEFMLEERKIPHMLMNPREFIREMKIRADDFKPFSFRNTDKVILEPGSKYVIELDAGELTMGYPVIRTESGEGSRLTIRYAESYTLPPVVQFPVKGVRDDSLNYRLMGYEDIYYPPAWENVYEPFWFRTFRFIRIEAEVGNEPLILFKPEYIETGYPLEVHSEIRSSEKWIEQFWDISVRTLRRCMHEIYMDCPYYEQMQYQLDTRVEALFTYAVSGDTRLALKAIEEFHSALTPEGILLTSVPSTKIGIIPVFSLYWILMLEDYYWQTGDIDVIKRYRPTVDAVLDWFERKKGSYGLTEKYLYWEFVDWAEEWQNEINQITGIPKACYHGPSTTNNLLYAYVLNSAAAMMEATGRKDTALEYIKRAKEIHQNIEKYCWDEEKGMYREGPEVEEYTQHAQAMAVLSGLASGEKAKRILINSLEAENVNACTYVFSYFLFRALEKTGCYGLTEKLWDKWKCLLGLNITTWPEDPNRQRSDCHGWSALPLYEFTRYILGVRPEEPGWNKIRIEPLTLSLPDAGGKVITPKGLAEVNWSKTDKEFKICGKAPEGIYTRIVLQNTQVLELPEGGQFEYCLKY